MFESRDPQRSIAVGRTLIAGCALALAVGACGRSSASKDMPAPSANSVIAAMNTQPRIIESVAGSGTVGRIIVDANARYLGLYSPSGMLTVMDKQGVEFRLLASGCYGRFAAAPVSTRVMWLGALEPLTSPRYTTTTSGETVIYRSSTALAGTVTVDARTRLIRSFSATRAPAYTYTYSYPASVTEPGAPTPLCY